jgi:hypothetical protein
MGGHCDRRGVRPAARRSEPTRDVNLGKDQPEITAKPEPRPLSLKHSRITTARFDPVELDMLCCVRWKCTSS